MLGIQRPLVVQDFFTFVVAVSNTVPTPINVNLKRHNLITSFAISNPLAGFSVYIGNENVTLPAGANAGFEIQPGTAPAFRIRDQRQIYELQGLQANIAEGLNCGQVALESIPFIVFDLSRTFLLSSNAAGSTVTVIAYPEMFV